MSSYDPYTGFAPAGNIPSYYNPYQNFTGGLTGAAPANQTVPGQQAGQALVPGKDTATPGSKHGKAGANKPSRTPVPGWVPMVSQNGHPAYVHPDDVPVWAQRGARRIG